MPSTTPDPGATVSRPVGGRRIPGSHPGWGRRTPGPRPRFGVRITRHRSGVGPRASPPRPGGSGDTSRPSPPGRGPGPGPGPALVRVAAALAATALLLGACHPGGSGAAEESLGPEPLASTLTSTPKASSAASTRLPSPGLPADEDAALPALLDTRHSTREFENTPLTLEDVSALLWAGYGVQSDGGRTVPSAGALYPLDLRLVTGAVDGLSPGVHVHRPDTHSLETVVEGDVRAELASAALDQESIAEAPAVLVVAGTPDRLRDRYGDRSERFALLEAGHVGQNLALAAQSLGLGLVTIGSFDDRAVARILLLGEGEQVHYLVPVGHPR